MLSLRSTVFVALLCVFSASVCSSSVADTILTENFNSLGSSGTSWGTQYQSGLNLRHSSDITGWSKSGSATCHAVEMTSGDWALLLWGNGADSGVNLNTVTLNTGVAANTAETTYQVAFDAGPGVYMSGNQVTESGDQFVMELLNPSNNVVASKTVSPDAWAGSEVLKAYSFTYTGDGTGDVRVRIRSLASVDTDNWNFVGAIDNLSISSIPEPATGAITMSAALVALLAYVWRKRK